MIRVATPKQTIFFIDWSAHFHGEYYEVTAEYASYFAVNSQDYDFHDLTYHDDENSPRWNGAATIVKLYNGGIRVIKDGDILPLPQDIVAFKELHPDD